MSSKKIRKENQQKLNNWKRKKYDQSHPDAQKVLVEWIKQPYLYIKNQPSSVPMYDLWLTQLARIYMIWIDKTAQKQPEVKSKSEQYRIYARDILDQFDPEFCTIKAKKPTKLIRCQRSLNIIDPNEILADDVDDKKLNDALLKQAEQDYNEYCNVIGTVMTYIYNESCIADTDLAFIKTAINNMYKAKTLEAAINQYDTIGGVMIAVLLYIFEDIALFNGKLELLARLKLYMMENRIDLKTMLEMDTFDKEYPGISKYLKKMSLIKAVAECRAIIHDNFSLYKILMTIVSDVQYRVDKLYTPNIIEQYSKNPIFVQNVGAVGGAYNEFTKKQQKEPNSTWLSSLCSFILTNI